MTKTQLGLIKVYKEALLAITYHMGIENFKRMISFGFWSLNYRGDITDDPDSYVHEGAD